ncbi:MAG: hypothetical protein ACMXYG_07140 [Candidatus Woesearchaeota archaeon]
MRITILLIFVSLLVFGLLAYTLFFNMISFVNDSEDCQKAGGVCYEFECPMGYMQYDQQCDIGKCCMLIN